VVIYLSKSTDIALILVAVHRLPNPTVAFQTYLKEFEEGSNDYVAGC
jgi:hypothetical protein